MQTFGYYYVAVGKPCLLTYSREALRDMMVACWLSTDANAYPDSDESYLSQRLGMPALLSYHDPLELVCNFPADGQLTLMGVSEDPLFNQYLYQEGRRDRAFMAALEHHSRTGLDGSCDLADIGACNAFLSFLGNQSVRGSAPGDAEDAATLLGTRGPQPSDASNRASRRRRVDPLYRRSDGFAARAGSAHAAPSVHAGVPPPMSQVGSDQRAPSMLSGGFEAGGPQSMRLQADPCIAFR